MRTLAQAAVIVVVFCVAPPAEATCRLGLAMGLDTSASIDTREYRLQRDGLAAALMSPAVLRLLFASRDSWITVAVYEWGGESGFSLIVNWTELRQPSDLESVIGSLAAPEAEGRLHATALGRGLGYGATLLGQVPGCARRTLDISGDGRNNSSFPPATAFRTFPFDGVTVNGLVILGDEPGLLAYFRTEVIRGPGAFVEVANGYANYEEAMRRKLERELAPPIIGMTAPDRKPALAGG